MDYEALYNSFMENKLGLDDTFSFKCHECGKCCHNRHDIILTAYDLFRIAKHLGKRPGEIITKHCEVYIGENSRIPLVRAVPKIHDAVCPFLRKGRCSVHTSKPILCATFPLGRIHTRDKEVFYNLQDVSCGDKSETHTVREWLSSFNIPEADATGLMWSEAIMFLSEYMIKQKRKDNSVFEPLWEVMTRLLYVAYDTDKDFGEQFKLNFEILKGVMLSNKRDKLVQMLLSTGGEANLDVKG